MVTFTGRSAFFARARSHGLDVDNGLAAKAAADFHGNGFHLAHRHANEASGEVAHGELPLTAGPDGEAAVRAPVRRGRVGLDVALVHRRGVRLFFHDDRRRL